MVLRTPMFNEHLEQLEKQINRYRALLSGYKKLYFPKDIEQDYKSHSNLIFIKSSRNVLSFGVLFYLAFGITDYALGQENKDTLWLIRVFIAGTLLSGIAILFSRRLIRWVVLIVTLGMIVIGLSILVFIHILDEPYSYAYHFGFIPWQVFILISLRSFLKPIIVASLTVFFSYIIFSYNQVLQPYSPEIDGMVDDARGLFILFWSLLIAMGVYLGYFMELSSRIDYVKNHLLELDSQRLTLLSEELHWLSTTDALTGLANRRHFESSYEGEWRRAIRAQDSLAVIMIDIDFFKKFNDQYGHSTGDKVLEKVAKCIIDTCRSGDISARWGGEEFIIIFPDTLPEAAQMACKRLKKYIVDSTHDLPTSFTYSGGIALLNDQDDSKTILDRADIALYKAKEKGRNKVITATDNPTH